MKMRNIKKWAAISMSILCLSATITGCGSKAAGADNNASGKITGEISVISREDGSGTRGAFIELFGIEQKDASGKKVDYTTEDATFINSTAIMMTTVSEDTNAIGYTSLGSLNSTIKALKVDGIEATAENVKSGKYKISRPFNIATKGTVSEVSQDLINYIMSKDGQAIVEANGYISSGNTGAFTSSKASGKIVIAGSSSVTPVMEKLVEAYKKVNTAASIEIQESDSTTGMNSAISGICDIGMASRELKDSEKSFGLTSKAIAMDGIAVIVNTKNNLENITSEQVKSIFTGETTDWSEIN
jgi:phosphate transport system substrate-binding protein